MDVVNEIAMLDVIDFSNDYPALPFGELPVIGYDPGLGLLLTNFVFVHRACLNNDADGVCSGTEDQAPSGDGNGDGTLDRDQANVATIIASLGNTATFSADAAMKFDFVAIINSGTALSWLTTFTPPPDQSAHFNNGVFTFTMTGAMGVSSGIVTLYDGAVERPTHYYAHGPTLDNPVPHWYDFTFDGVTGAEIGPDRITLHFVDGMRGDDDLTANDSITHTGGQAVVTPIDSTSNGGCSIAATPSQPSRGGDWMLVSMFLVLLAIVRRRARQNRIQHSALEKP
jgi:MYXO-CTERM domain-containing protein